MSHIEKSIKNRLKTLETQPKKQIVISLKQECMDKLEAVARTCLLYTSLLGILFRNYSLSAQHFRMRYAAGYVLAVHTAVKAYGRMKIVHKPAGFLFKSSAPELHLFILLILFQHKRAHF